MVLKESNLNDQTILDYRDFLARNQKVDRSRSLLIHAEAFVTGQGLHHLSEKERAELPHHAHSDLDSSVDEDPFYEYNQCQKVSKLELPDTKKKFQEIEIKKFFSRERTETNLEVNINEEIHRLVQTKYHDVMDEICNPQNIIDSKEFKTFDCYNSRNKHMSDHSGIPNYATCWYPLPPTYFEGTLEKSSTAKKRITPSIPSTEYSCFPNSSKVQDQVCNDLLAFERYAKFDVASLEAVQIREAIIEDLNQATPAAMFEGSLE